MTYRNHWALIWGLVLSVFTALSGCSSRIPAPYEINQGGHILVGLGTNRYPELHSLELYVRELNVIPTAGSKGVIRLCRLDTCDKPDYSDADRTGLVIARRLPPGKYVISTIQATFFEPKDGFGLFAIETNKPVNIPFEIKPGQTSYLGRFWLNEYVSDKQRKFAPGGHAVVEVRDELQRDRQIAVKKMPVLHDTTESYQPDANAIRELANITKIRKYAKEDRTTLRSEKLSDGKEPSKCQWWCS